MEGMYNDLVNYSFDLIDGRENFRRGNVVKIIRKEMLMETMISIMVVPKS
jgi:hypothetical protein